jgi:hypothetical protein
MRLIGTERTRHSSKVRELYEAVRREQDGIDKDVTEHLTCESALREAGVDEALIAKKLKEQLEAKQPRWNPKKKAFDLFPDHDARLAALREAIKIFGGYPAAERDDPSRAPLIIDFTDSWASPFRKGGRRERGEHCEADTTVSGIGSDGLGNRTTSKP